MGIYVNGYLKDPEAIKGETKTVGFYDVDYEKIISKKILENDISFPGSDLYLIAELQSVYSLIEYGIYKELYLWYFFIPNYMTGQGIINFENKEIITMFDPKLLLGFTKRIVEVGNELKSTMNDFVQEEIENRNELGFFGRLFDLLLLAEKKDAIIGITIG
ncbi:hypothetical protein [Polluticaenibacter yanchengensis]|uniref:DUF1877 family protein n=1 Tax=Polluticaenibacter yanchengensis TaxID=3014562 RepID=A0ABT4UN75_9BACT|nr:hypothetical protein [Chitinophagaceae bacterium LY-5]